MERWKYNNITYDYERWKYNNITYDYNQTFKTESNFGVK